MCHSLLETWMCPFLGPTVAPQHTVMFSFGSADVLVFFPPLSHLYLFSALVFSWSVLVVQSDRQTDAG